MRVVVAPGDTAAKLRVGRDRACPRGRRGRSGHRGKCRALRPCAPSASRTRPSRSFHRYGFPRKRRCFPDLRRAGRRSSPQCPRCGSDSPVTVARPTLSAGSNRFPVRTSASTPDQREFMILQQVDLHAVRQRGFFDFRKLDLFQRGEISGPARSAEWRAVLDSARRPAASGEHACVRAASETEYNMRKTATIHCAPPPEPVGRKPVRAAERSAATVGFP